MSEHITSPEKRLLALTRYISALEQGEIEPLSGVLHEAERDPVLAQLLQEIHMLYQENEHVTISELEARRAAQLVLAPQQASSLSQNGHGVSNQPAKPVPLVDSAFQQNDRHGSTRRQPELQEIRIQRGNKEIIMDERTSVMSLENNSELPPHKPARRRWLGLMAAILAICVLIAGTPLLLNLRGQTGNHGTKIQTAMATPQSGQNQYQALASQYVSHMNLNDEIGQLLMVEYDQSSYTSNLDSMLNTLHVGGVIMYAFQMTSLNQVKGDITHMQQRANIPLLISTDEEGCPYVERLKSIYGCRMNATQIGASGDVNIARQQGLKVSQDLTSLGINVNLAPDVDVNQNNGYDMVTRTFGSTPDQVIKYAGAYLQAMQGNGTVACLEHFPGLGAATTDAHTTLPVVNSSKQQIYNVDLAPFKSFIQSSNALLNPGMIMPTDELVPTIDSTYPAELSHTFITDILRNEFHYNGVVLADALYMAGIHAKWNLNQAAVLALQAGDDMLLGVNGSQQASSMIDAIKQAVQNGQLTKARIDQSVTRIIALKMQYHLMSATA